MASYLSEDPNQAIVLVEAKMPDNAVTVELLGEFRSGFGARIRQDGLIITVGYIVTEAEEVWVSNSQGEMVSAHVVANDFDCGLALLRPDSPLAGGWLAMSDTQSLRVGGEHLLYNNFSEDVKACKIEAKQSFAGRWEYLVENALFTSPAIPDWTGALMVDENFKLCALGAMALQIPSDRYNHVTNKYETYYHDVNLFIPVEKIIHDIDHLVSHGVMSGPPRPWLGTLIQEHSRSLIVVGLYPQGPAQKSGLQVGDLIVSLNEKPVFYLLDFLELLYGFGAAGVEVELVVVRESKTIKVCVQSADRHAYFITSGHQFIQ